MTPQDEPTGPLGLTAAEALRRLGRDGFNEIEPPRRRTLWRTAREAAREPMLQLLVAAGIVYLLLGDVAEALALMAFVAVSAAITIVQEQRTGRALDALRDMASPRALVIRDGGPCRIAGRDVVQGDLLVLAEGDRVPADALLIDANDLQLDESLLTGESMPIAKFVAAPGDAAHGLVFAGTLVVAGKGLARVNATGTASQIGRIGHSLGRIETPPTPLVLQIRGLVRLFSVAGLGLSLGVALVYGLTRHDGLGGILAGITLAMSMLPQEFPLILTVFMAMGAWRMSRQRVLTRRAATLEALGSATVLCTDKTGTLTLNRMTVVELLPWTARGRAASWVAGTQSDPGAMPPRALDLLEAGLLACEREPFDPMEKAFELLGRGRLPPDRLHAGWVLAHEYPLSPGLPAMTHVWRAPGGGACHVAVKGASEAVIGLCRLDPHAAAAAEAAARDMARRGLRVLGVARARFEGLAWPACVQDFSFEFLGLVALADPLRPGVPDALRECASAGIRVVMITGDHPATADAIARQAGLAADGSVATGAELEQLDERALRARLGTATVFARVAPQQKLRIVEALKAGGHVVAMTGDGVNDAPSLKAAHIGIAMGGRGTDVAREAAALVLLDDDFGSIVRAVRLGRRIFDNLRKAMAFVLAVHVPIAGLSLLPLLLGWPLVFMPVHIAFLELLIDPVCSIVFEAEDEEEGVMARPPRDPSAPLFSVGLIAWSLLQGGLVLAAITAFFGALLAAGVAAPEARAAAFTALVAANVALIMANRSLSGRLLAAWCRPNAMLRRMLLATAALLAAALFIPPLRGLFGFATLRPGLLLAALAIGVPVLLALEVLKRVAGRHVV